MESNQKVLIDVSQMTKPEIESLRDEKLKELDNARLAYENLIVSYNEKRLAITRLEGEMIQLRTAKSKAVNVKDRLRDECEYLKSKWFRA